MISITNLAKISVDKKFLTDVAKIVLKGENEGKGKEVSIVLVSPAEIKKLNKKYRGKNEATDVLSFSGTDEIVICPGIAEDISFVLIHGLLHLLGYGHGTEMRKKEKYYLSKI